MQGFLLFPNHHKSTEFFQEKSNGPDTFFGWGDMKRMQKSRQL
jgi:hypothetical protein